MVRTLRPTVWAQQETIREIVGAPILWEPPEEVTEHPIALTVWEPHEIIVEIRGELTALEQLVAVMEQLVGQIRLAQLVAIEIFCLSKGRNFVTHVALEISTNCPISTIPLSIISHPNSPAPQAPSPYR